MKRILTALLFALGLTVLLALSVGAESGTATFYNGETVYTTANTDENGLLTLPAGPAGSEKFVGWSIEVGDLEVLYPAGASVELPAGESVFRAETVALRTLTGAAVSIGSPTTLRFDGALSLADYQRLVSLVGADKITLGLLIAPSTAVYGAQNDSSKFIHGSAADGLLVRTSVIAYSTAEQCVFTGRTDAIADDMLLESYSARAYLTVQTQDGSVTVYADYDPEKHDRMAHYVTAMAFEDRTESCKSGHIYTTADAPDHYAFYPESILEQLEARLDKVISVSQWNSTTQSVEIRVVSEYAKDIYGGFTAFKFYASPYRVDRVLADDPAGFDTYVIVAEEGADFNNVKVYFIGHSYRPPSPGEWKADGIYISVRNETGAPF